MAVDLRQTKPSSGPKYEAVFEQQLGRAVGRVRFLDVTAALLGWGAAALLYALVLMGLDRWLEITAFTRQVLFILFLLGSGIYLGLFLVRPLFRRVNPYYAARRLEATVPDAKNSVVNWLDLRDDPLPPTIRSAVGQKAARDALSADVDAAIGGRHTVYAGSAVGLLCVAFLILLAVLGPAQFWSLLGRAFAPFRSGAIQTRTQIELHQPQGDALVPINRSVAFAAFIGGKVPPPRRADSPRVLFHYRPADPFEELPLQPDHDGEWVATLGANQVHNGFTYKIAAGDAETPEYQVRVRSTPLVEKIDVLYRYRPYLGWKDETSQEPNLKAPRGTEVTLAAHTNRSVKTGVCTLHEGKDARQQLAGEPIAGDPHALKFRFTIERDGEYRISFTSTEGEASPESLPYTITALRDYPPTVELKKPGKDISLPVNGLLELEGFASDDNGVAGMTLRLKVVEGAVLQAKPYRAGKSFRLQDGGYPKMLDYKDSVELEKLMDEQGKPAALKPKMEIEYWLEAADACDYPGPNVAASQHYKVILGEPNQDQKQQQTQRDQAAQDQKKHEQKQDQKLKEENEKRQQQQQQNQSSDPEKSQEQGDKGNGGDPQAKDAEEKLEKAFEQQDRQNDQKNDSSEQNSQQKDNQNGQGAPQPGQAKDKGNPGSGGSGQGNEQPDASEQPGQEKGEGNQPDEKAPPKGENKKNGQKGAGQEQGTGKERSDSADAAETKQGGSPQNKPGSQDDSKQGADQGAKPEKASGKDQGHGKDGPNSQPAEPKQPGQAGPMNDQKQPGDAKPGDASAAKGERKDGGKPENADGQQQGKPKDDASSKPDGQREKPGGNPQANGKEPGKNPKDEPKNAGGSGGDPGKKPEKDNPEKGTGGSTGPKQGPDKGTDSQPGATGKGEKSGEKATPEDVARMAQQMQKEQGQKQEDAARQLAQAAQNARDASAREQARQALEQAGRDPQTGEPNPGEAKQGPTKQGSAPKGNAPTAESKGQPGDKKGTQGEAKDQSTGQDQPPRSERKDGGSQGDGPNGQKLGQKPDAAGAAKGRGSEKDDVTKAQGTGGGKPGDARGEDEPTAPGAPPSDRDRRKRGELLLERFDKMLEKDKKKFLEGAHLSEEDLKHLREDIARRKTQRPEGPERAPKAAGRGTVSDRAATRVEGTGKPRAADNQYGGAGAPPRQFADIFREFTSGPQEKK